MFSQPPNLARTVACWCLFFPALGLNGNARAANPANFDLANQSYDQGQYAEARLLYKNLVQAHNYSANLFYNLGNTEVRLGALGAAALAYERALALDPAHPEAKANLAFVRTETGAKIEDRTWLDSLFVTLDANNYTILLAAAAWLAATCGAVVFMRAGRGSALWPLGTWTALAVCAYACAALWHFQKNDALAIVTAKRAAAHFAPADNSTLADNLPTGSQVRILSERGAWVYCELPNKARAWIAAGEIERVPPGA